MSRRSLVRRPVLAGCAAWALSAGLVGAGTLTMAPVGAAETVTVCDKGKLGFGTGVMTSTAVGSASWTIVAPHGHVPTGSTTGENLAWRIYDPGTERIVERMGPALGANRVVAKGYETSSTRANVNRPTELVGGSVERRTTRARNIYDRFRTCTLAMASRVRNYVEIHGYSNAASIQVATVGVSAAEASAAKKAWGDRLGVSLVIEPVDTIEWNAKENKAIGMLALKFFDRAIHIELPVALRKDARLAETSAALTDWLTRQFAP